MEIARLRLTLMLQSKQLWRIEKWYHGIMLSQICLLTWLLDIFVPYANDHDIFYSNLLVLQFDRKISHISDKPSYFGKQFLQNH